MPKRLAAALLALLTFAAALAVIPLASPAEAHPQTTTKQYCAYDPFAGNQCWTQAVSVAHHHPPANQSCPAGTTGTPPNCYPAPSTNQQNTGDEEAKKRAEEARKKAEEEKKRKAEEEAKRKADEEARRQRKAAEEEAKRRAEQEAQRKAAEEAERKRKEAEEEANNKKNNGGTGTGTTTSNDPCGDYAENLVNALSKAAHGGAYNPPTKPDGCDGLSTSETVGSVGNFFKRALAWWGSEEQKRSEFTREVSRAHIENLQKLWNAIPEDERETLIDTGTTIGLGSACLALTMGEETTSLTPGAQSASAHLSAAAISVCVAALGKLVDTVSGDDGDGQQPNNPQPDGDGGNQDDGDSSEQGDGHPGGTDDDQDGSDPQQPDPDNADDEEAADDDSAQQPNDPRPADDDSDTPSTPEEWDQAVKEAEEKWRRGGGGIDGDELTRIQNERDCAYGHPWAQNCP